MEIEYIPIGTKCWATHELKKYGFRKSAYPFDWQVTSMESFYEACKNNFDGLLDDMCIGDKVHRFYFVDSNTSNNPEVKETKDYIYPVICKKYNILFPHYFHKIDDEFVRSVRGKMKKRIESFNKIVLDDSVEKKFIYFFDDLNEWQAHCFDLCKIDRANLFINENQMKYLSKSKELFADKKVEFIELYDLLNNHNL